MNGGLNGTAASVWRMPRARVLVNGVERAETGLEEFTLARTRYSRADTLDMTLAVDRTRIPSGGLWFDLQPDAQGGVLPDIDITVQMRDAARDGAQWVTVFRGIVDHVGLLPAATSVRVQCRDYLAKLLDMRVRAGWLNMTGADVVRAMITAAGLVPDVTMTDAMVGQFWQVEHKRMSATTHSRFQTAFDLARYMATMAGCDLYADGTTIVCAPCPTATTANTHVLDYTDSGPDSPVSMGATGLHFTRDYQVGRGVIVHVMSWDSRQRTRVEYYWSAAGGATTPGDSAGTLHSFALPGARLDDLRRLAQQKYSQITAHARTITGTIPGRITLAPRGFMRLTGTGTTWDGTLDVDAVTSSFSWQGGFSQQVTLRARTTTQDGGTDD
ncbi:hypothetical protein LU298_13545 [Komagataeibacter intermedius]|uniref:Uncharacterized protein n=2 Tax=Komagataeibacter intermedius TaxID=66229 RepID=A0A0N0MDX3_9PROT|nr:hypothetical protein [Komagataeibacter intermedius]KPH85793.1 hypothetical protein GLUCOINTEAF2_0201048 [Komagataeibacter intermedius AF2]MCF3637514.1 hypothetical protein [Komagataeibacter intermedius]GAN88062.1 hypothetical protein Gain_0128_003 [Komagataeibacter intermedius TF2]GBQ79237.1 hypothetical protein AA0521_3392 [Komagataeibacter intermedius NRIC 0521]